jgi:cholesterol transport system auxiliary component
VKRPPVGPVIGILAAMAAGGCALFTRGTPLQLRYFDPEPLPRPAAVDESPASEAGAPCALRLGDISASDTLGESIAFRSSPYQVGYYETRRWSQSPENYLRRTIERRMFDERRCHRALSGGVLTLDARLLTFEEQRGPTHRARVTVHVVVSDGNAVIHEETIDRGRPCDGGEGDAAFVGFVRAMSLALDDVGERLVQIVLLSSARTAPQGG